MGPQKSGKHTPLVYHAAQTECASISIESFKMCSAVYRCFESVQEKEPVTSMSLRNKTLHEQVDYIYRH